VAVALFSENNRELVEEIELVKKEALKRRFKQL
jgi:hypothetical protein